MAKKLYERFVQWTLFTLLVSVSVGGVFTGISTLLNYGIFEAIKVFGATIIGVFGIAGLNHIYSRHIEEEKEAK